MGKHSLDLEIRQSCDLFDLFHTLRYICITNPGHTCVQRNMDMYCLILQNSLLRKLLCFLIFAHCQTDIISYKFRIIFLKNNSKDQDRFCNPVLTQMNSFFGCCSRKSPDVIITFDQMCDRNCTMTISICFDHSDHLCILRNILSHFPEVLLYGIQGNHCFYSAIFIHNNFSSVKQLITIRLGG